MNNVVIFTLVLILYLTADSLILKDDQMLWGKDSLIYTFLNTENFLDIDEN